MNRETVVKYLRDAVPLGEHPTPHAEFITVRLDTVQAAADAIEAFDDDKVWFAKPEGYPSAKGRDMRQATDEEIKAAFDRHLKASNLPAQIKNGDYRSGWVRQAWASFYSGWRRCEDRKMDNVAIEPRRVMRRGYCEERKEQMENWKTMLYEALKENGETWADIEANTMTEEEMAKEFDAGYGLTEGCSFTVWTKKRVYFPICYDGAEWVGSVSRNPDGKPTDHQGGG